MNKHTITHPDGTTSTRNSKTRTYLYCVEVFSDGSYGVVGWAGNLQNALKTQRQWQKVYPGATVRDVDKPKLEDCQRCDGTGQLPRYNGQGGYIGGGACDVCKGHGVVR
jgi:hypothetical protein